jgi:8-oxo-dGTP diphosphatase
MTSRPPADDAVDPAGSATPRSSPVTATAHDIADLVRGIHPHDGLEVDHQGLALAWLACTDDLFRRVKPATPSPHLVSYFLPIDTAARRLLLVDHRRAGLWLPPGGHVEPGEHPLRTVAREGSEELGIEVEPLFPTGRPSFLTWTATVGPDSHIDVSLWYLLRGDACRDLQWDRREFASIRWWSPAEVRRAEVTPVEPHLHRMLDKLERIKVWSNRVAAG